MKKYLQKIRRGSIIQKAHWLCCLSDSSPHHRAPHAAAEAAAGALETSAPSPPAARAELGQNPWPISTMVQSVTGICVLFLCNKKLLWMVFSG